MRQWIKSALVQIMACRLFGAKPLSEQMLTYFQLAPQEQTSVKIWIKIQFFLFKKMFLKKSSAKLRPFSPGETSKVNTVYLIGYTLRLHIAAAWFDNFRPAEVATGYYRGWLYWQWSGFITFKSQRQVRLMYSSELSICNTIYLLL